ncbi:hypothetical protein [Desulfomarina sp.]
MKNSNIYATITVCFLIILSPLYSPAAEKDGWENGSDYNSYYNAKERDSLKGILVKFKTVTPLSGMSPGTAFILREGDDDILVHLCPRSFADAKGTGLRKGVKTKVKGCWAFINGKDVFIASKVKQGEHFEFKVRLTKDGTPFWTMSPDELKKERNSK